MIRSTLLQMNSVVDKSRIYTAVTCQVQKVELADNQSTPRLVRPIFLLHVLLYFAGLSRIACARPKNFVTAAASSGAPLQRHVTTDYVNTAFSAIFFHGKAVCKTHVANACSWPLRERLRSFRFNRFYRRSCR